MTTGYTPKWKTDEGDVVIFAAYDSLFDTREAASNWMIVKSLIVLPFGLKPAGVLEFEHQNGKFELPHIKADVPQFGPCMIIEGPLFDETQAAEAAAATP